MGKKISKTFLPQTLQKKECRVGVGKAKRKTNNHLIIILGVTSI